MTGRRPAPQPFGRRRSSAFVARLALLALLLPVGRQARAAYSPADDLPGPPAHLETVPAGSLVIPMDHTLQAVLPPFNLKAYGLANHLLKNNVPLKWAMRAGKAKDGVDFTATAQRIAPTAIPAASVNFAGGPLIVHRDFAVTAKTLITAFGNSVAVYEMTADAVVDIRYDLTHKPRIAVSNVNTAIHTAIFTEAGIPASDYTIVDPINLGAASCYTSHSEPHTGATAGIPNVKLFLQSGGNFLAQCQAASTYENDAAGRFQTTLGMKTNNKGNALSYPNPDLAYSQYTSALEPDPGGSEKDWKLETGSVFQNNAHVHAENIAIVPLTWAASASKIRNGKGGNVYYLGGHDYGGSAALGFVNGRRMFLNFILVPAERPAACNLDILPDLRTISGVIYEDVNGDAGLGDAVTRPGVRVRLYTDANDNGVVDAGDVFLSEGTTGAAGDYSFQVSISATGNKYLVAADSRGVIPSAGFNAGFVQGDVWAEQTLGDDSATAVLDVGPRFGGRTPGTSDNFSASTTPASNNYQHLARADLTAASVSGADFAFSFQVITHAADRDDDLTANRTAQGSLRQAIQNANAIAGAVTLSVPANTYTLALAGLGENAALAGDLDVTDGLTLNGAGAPTTIIDASGIDRVFHALAGTTLSGMTIRGGDPGAAADGGGVLVQSGVVASLTQVTVTANAGRDGAGLFSGSATLTVDRSTISTNSATGSGGGISNAGTLSLVNVTISGNTAVGGGGGIDTSGGAATLTNVTLKGNTSAGSDGIRQGATGSTTLKNTLLDNGAANNCSGVIGSSGYNLETGSSCGLAGAGDQSNTDPLLGPLVDNGGPTFTHALPSGSPAIDTGTNTGAPTVDQRGVARPFDGDYDSSAVTDIGAFEFNSPPSPADLSLVKVVDNTTPDVGTDVVFTLTVSNAGPGIAFGVVVTDLLPAGYTYVSDDGAGAYASGTGVWTAGTIAAGGSKVLNITATVLGSGSYINTAEVTAAVNPDPDSTPGDGMGDDYAAVSPVPVPTPVVDLSVTKVVDNPTPNVGADVVFSVTVSNAAGFSPATGVVVTDLLPGGYTHVSDDGGGAYVSGTGVWTVGALAAGSSATLNITARVLSSGSYTNAAEVTAAGQPDTDSTPGDGMGDDYATVSPTPTPTIDLSVTKLVDDPTPDVGTNVVFTVTVSNAPLFSAATGVVVTDLLPGGYSHVGNDGGGAYVPGTGVWTVGALAAGGSATLNITARVLGSGSYANAAEVTAAVEPDTDSTPGDGAGDDHATASTAPNAVIDLSLSKVVDIGAPSVGSDVVFTVTVTNAASFSDATGVAVTDLLPAGYAYVSDDGGGAYVPGTGVWTVGALAAGGSATLNITATVLGSGPYTNPAEVTAADQPDADSTPGDGMGDDYDTASTTPGAVIDLGVTKAVDDPTPDVGANVVFTVTVANEAGFSDATGVAVTDLLPSGYAYVSDDGGGAYVPGTGVWTVGALASGSSATLNVTATVLGSGSYANAAEVTAAVEPDTDSTPGDGMGDDYDSVATTPNAVIDLSLTKVVDDPTPDVGANVVFTVTVANAAGFSAATGVAVTDLLPTGYAYVSDDGGGAYVPGTGVWTVGALAAGGSATLNITATVLGSGSYANAAEVTGAAQPDTDSTPGDGSGDDYDTATTTPNAVIDLSLTKVVDDPTPDVGTDVVFTVTVSNAAGFSDATGVAVTDLLPAGYAYVSDDGGGAYVSATGVWTVGALSAGSSATLNITATVLGSGSYTNAAEVTGAAQPDTDSTPGDGAGDDYDTATTAPNLLIDLSLTKVVDDPTPDVGTNVVFTVTVANAAGFNDATGVAVTDLLPAGYAYVSDDGGGAYVPGTGVWTVGALAAGGSATLNITATVLGSGSYSNAAEVTAAGQPDTDSTPGDGAGDDYATVSTTPNAMIDLSLTKVVDDPTPDVGTNVVFTVTVTNAASFSDATGVAVTDLLSAGYAYVSDDGGGAYVPGTGVWTVGALSAGSSATLNITATVLGSGSYTNAAEVTGAGQPDTDSTPGDGAGDDYATASPTPNAVIDLSVTKVVDDPTPDVGTNVVFTVTVANAAGLSDATGVAVTDLLPAGYAYVSDDGGGAYVPGTGVWTVGALSAGSSATLNITATVLGSGSYTNAAEVTAAGQTDADSTPGDAAGDDYATAATTPNAVIDLSVTKVVDDPTPDVGTNVVFTVTVTNAAGFSNATGVALTDLLPAGYAYVSDDGGGAYVPGTGVWTVGALSAGSSATLNITATVLGGGSYANAAEVTAAGQPDADSTPGDSAGDDYATASTTPNAVIDLSVTKVVDDPTPDVGTNVVFTVTVTNAASFSNATGVTVTDLLPAGYGYVSDDGGGSYVPGTGVWTVGALAAGGSATLNITATVLASGSYTNAVEVTAAGQPDADSTPGDGAGDDYATASTTPSAVIDLSLAKAVDDPTPNVGASVVFTLTVTNAGPSAATGVAVTDLLPAGYTYVSDDGGGAYVPGTGVWTVGGVAAGASEALDITASVDAAGPYLNTTEVTAANETDLDSTPNNAITTEDDYAERLTTPTPVADLSLAKTVNVASPAVGTDVIFTLTVTNGGPSAASGVEVTDLLPAGYTYVSDDSGGAYVPGTGVWSVGGVVAGGSQALAITATVNAAGPYLNTAEVTAANETDPDSTPNNGITTEDDYAQRTTTPGAVIDLSVTKVVDDPTPDVGTNVVFTVTVANDAGFSDATGVAVTDLLPAGYAHVSDDGGGAYVPGTGVWTVGALSAGSSAALNVTATVLGSGGYTNAAEVTAADQPDTDSTPGDGAGDDYATASTTPNAVIDLSVTKVADDPTPDVGTNVVFTVTVSNAAGFSAATGVAVTDLLPAGYAYVGDDGGGAYVPGTGVWTVGALAAGSGATLNITATVLGSGSYSNAAEVTAAGEPDTDSTPGDGAGDDYATASPTPNAVIDLSVTKVVDDPTPDVGTNVVFTVTVANAAGLSDATGVAVTDLLPAGYAHVSDDGGGAYVPGTGVWTVGALAAGSGATLNITATVLGSGSYANAAEVTAAGQTDADSTPGDGAGDDYATASTTPNAVIDLSVNKVVDNGTPGVGSDVVFTVTVANAASFSDATGVVVTDLLPTGYAYVSDDGGGAYVPGTGVWTVGALAAGSGAALNITATVLGSGSYANAAEVTAAGEPDTDSTPGDGAGDDYATASTTPGAVIRLLINKMVDDSTPDVGMNVVFTVIVSNTAGFSDATGVVVTDLLPTGYAYVSDDGGGAYVPGTGVWSVGSVAAGSSDTLNVTARVLGSGNHTNEAEVTAANEPDFNSTFGDGTGDDYGSISTTPNPVVDLSVTKVVDDPTPDVGTNVVFTVTVVNDALFSDATGVAVTDLLPAGYAYVSDDGGGAYVPGTGVWTVGALAAGSGATLNITATVLGSGSYSNAAEVTAAGEPDTDSTPGDGAGDDYATASPTPNAVIDLSVTKVVDDPTPDVGTNVVFTVTVSNAAGFSAATGVAVTDLLPAGYAYVGDDGGGAYVPGTGVWTVGALAAGSGATLNITATVLGGGSYANAAEVTAAGEPDTDSTPGDGAGDDYATASPTPNAVIDLSVTKVVDDPTPDVGTNVVFTVTVANAAGLSDATGVAVTDLLPAGYAHVSDDGGGAYVPGTGVWTVGALAAGSSATLNITATVLGSGSYANAAEVTAAGQPDTDSTPGDGAGDDYATVSTTPNAVIDLSLTKVVDDPTPDVGTNVVFTVTVTNAASFSDATGVVVTDLLPAGYAYVSDDGGGAYVPGTGIWTVGALSAGSGATLNITATVLGSGSYANAAEVTGAGEPDTDSTPGDGAGDDYATASPTPNAVIDLSVTKAVDDPTPDVGTSVVFTVTVANAAGLSDATGVIVTDLLPAGYAYVSDDGGGAYVPGTGVWTVGALAAGSSAALNITATVLGSGSYTNAAEVTAAGQTDADSTPGDAAGDDYATASTTPNAMIDLSVNKVVDNGTPGVGSDVVFTVTVANAASFSDATGVVVNDLLPTGYAYVSDDGGGAYVPGTGVWTVGALAAGSGATLNVTATVLGSGSYTNAAEVTSAGEPDTDSTPGDGAGDDYATASPTPTAVIDLSVTKVVDDPTPDVGTNVVFTVTVANAASFSDATGVAVTDLLPAGYAYVSDDGGGAYVPGTGVWTVGALPAGSSAALNITATVLGSGSYANTAEVTAAGQPDTDSTPGDGAGDDYATASTTPNAMIDLSVTKVVDDPTPDVGTNVVFTVTVANAASFSAATGVAVTDLLPAGYAYVGDDGGGAYVPGTGVWTVGALSAGSGATLNITATVLGSGSYTNAAEVTAAGQPDADSTPGDGAGDDYAAASTTPNAMIDLSVTKVVDDPTPSVGANVVFTVTVRNAAGFSDATGVAVTDLLPAGYAYVGDDGGGAYVSGTGVFTVGALPAGSSATLNITATVLGSGSYSNAAEVTAAGEPDADSTPGDGAGDDYATASTTPGAVIDLSVTKVVDDPTPDVGTSVVFTVTVRNAAGLSDATGVAVTDLLPAGYAHVSDDGGGAYVPGTGVWTVGALSAGSGATLNITATVLGSGSYTNAAEVTAAGQTDADSTPGDGAGDDYATASTTPNAVIDVSLTKVVDDPTPSVGANVVFTVTVTNAAGFSDATGVAVTDLLPAGYAHVSDDGGGAYVLGTGVWTVGALAAGSGATLNVTATVLGSGSYTNAAEVTAAGEPDADSTPGDGAGDDYATASTTPGAVIDLSLTKSVDDPTPNIAANVIFTLTVSNAGPSGATGVAVTDLLPAGYTHVSDDGGGAYVPGTGVWTVGAVAAGGSEVLNITAAVNAAGPYLNTAEVTAANETDSDSTPNNGATTEDDYAEQGTTPDVPALTLSKSDSADPVLEGAILTYTLDYANTGTGGATGVVITDTVPANTTFVSATGGGTEAAGVVTWVLGALGAGASGSVQMTVQVASPLADGTIITNGTYAIDSDQTAPVGGPAVTTTVSSPRLRLLQTGSDLNGGSLNPGDTIEYTITVENAGSGDATAVVINDPVPASTTYVAGSIAGPGADDTGNPNLVWNIGVVAGGSTVTLTYRVTVDPGTPSGTIISNQGDLAAAGPMAMISDDPTYGDGVEAGNDPLDPNDDDPTLLGPVSLGDVLVVSIAVDPPVVRRGDFVLYTVTITNPTALDVLAANLRLDPSAGLAPVRGTYVLDGVPQADPPAAAAPVVPLGTVSAGQTMTLVVRGVVTSGARLGDLDTEARGVDAIGQPLSLPDTATVRLIEDPEFDLGTIIGKVFDDRDGDGVQGSGEKGVGGVMVAMEDGVYAVTDANGLYHIAAVRAGNRLVKINRHTLPPHDGLTMPETRTVTMTPGLLTKVNFGVRLKQPLTLRQGRPGTYGIAVANEKAVSEAQVIGNLDSMTAVVNGVQARLPRTRVKMDVMSLERNLRIVNGQLEKPAIFRIDYPKDRSVKVWSLDIYDGGMRRLRRFAGRDTATAEITWDGKDAAGHLVTGGSIYQYQLSIEFDDGSLSRSPLRLFGVNRTSAISFELTGASFDVNGAVLNASAKGVLDEIVITLKQYPDEKVVVRGHTDDTGTDDWNRRLSLRRAESVQRYLMAAGIDPERLLVDGRGADDPVAPNNTGAGRARNRRVEIKALLEDTERARVYARQAAAVERTVIVNGRTVPVDPDGSFQTAVDPISNRGRVTVGIRTEDGGMAATTVALPTVAILEPTTDVKLEIGDREEVIQLMRPIMGEGTLEYPAIQVPVRGRTEPGNQIYLDGAPQEVDADGSFRTALPLAVGENTFGVVAIAPNGYTSLVNLTVNLTGVDAQRDLIVVRPPVPQFAIELPPPGAVLSSPDLFLRGSAPVRAAVTVNATRLAVERDGSFAGSVRLPEGPSIVNVVVAMPDGSEARIGAPVTVKSDYLFLVALGDATVNKVTTTGRAPEQFDDELYVDGRVAFYLKGRIQGKYLITAGLDSGDGRLSDIGARLGERDNADFYRNLDPDAFYPVYGDGSRTVRDTNSQGRFYVLFEAPVYTATWGNYNSGITGNEFASFNRTLYGGKATWHSLTKAKNGEPAGQALVFAALPETRPGHDEFTGTGGSLYFLRNQMVVPGSEKVRLEVRDKITGIPVANVTRGNYVDYEIDYAEGRILFRTPVASVVESSTVVSDDLLNGNPVFVVVDYEYNDLANPSLDDNTYGARVKHAVGESVTVGATYVQEDRPTGTYTLQGGDVTLRLGGATQVTAEFSQSESEALPQFVSQDGGLSFNPKSVPASSEAARAYRVEVTTGGGPVRATGYVRHIDAGFSSSFTAGVNETDQLGATLAVAIGRSARVSLLVDSLDTAGVATVRTGTLQYQQTMGKFAVTVEARYRGTDNVATPDVTEGIGAIRFDYRPTERVSIYTRYQNDFLQELDGASGATGGKQQTSLGVDARISPKVTARAELTTADAGDSALVGLTTRVDDKTVLYGTYTMSPDQGGVVTNALTVGASTAVGDRTRLYTEEQFKTRDDSVSTSHVVGVNTRLTDRLTGNLAVERSSLDGSGGGADTLRQAASASVSYAHPRYRVFSKLELRHDEGTALDRDQWVASNALEFKLSKDFTFLGRYNYGVTTDNLTDADESIYHEQGVGFAYRPLAHDWVNVLARYTKVQNLAPGSQAPAAARDERTDQVFSFQTVVDLHRRVTLTEKYAVRDRELSPELFADLKSRMKLWINRFDYHVSDTWDAALEYRTLSQQGAGDNAADGFLLEVNRLFLKHLRLGVGYNFTDFSDNEVSANDYAAKGFFFRIQGKY